MDDHTIIYGILGTGSFLLFLAAVQHYGQRSPFPPESWLVVAGVAYTLIQENLIHQLPAISLDPQVVLFLLLPVLIFSSGRTLDPAHLKAEWLPIGFFSFIGVAFTALAIGLPLAWAMGIPWSHGLMFGTAVAATDPSAVTAIFQRFTLPERLSVIVEGESLFNDGTAIVLFTTAMAFVLGGAGADAQTASLRLAWSVAGAIPLGLLLGWLMGRLVAHWREQNRFTGLSLTLVLTFGSFLLAEHLLQVSGVITVLCAALAFIRSRWGNLPKDKLPQKEMFQTFWDYLNTLAGGILFFVLGAAVGAHAFIVNWVLVFVIILLVLARVVLVYPGVWLINVLGAKLESGWNHILGLAGLRGAVSAALVLLIPADYPHRIDLLCLVFVLVLFTLLVMPPLLRRYLQSIQT